MYTLRFHSAVAKDIRKLDPSVVTQLRKVHFAKIKQNPGQAEALSHDLKGLWSYHFSHKGIQYRIVYEIYPKDRLVLIIMIGPREGLYEALRRRIQYRAT